MVFSRHPRSPRASRGRHPGLLRFASSFAPTNFQQLTNCSSLDTDFAHSQSLYFQPITNCPFCKSFVLTFIQHAGGVGTRFSLSSRVPYALPSSVYSKSFVCHPYANFASRTVLRDENCWVWGDSSH